MTSSVPKEQTPIPPPRFKNWAKKKLANIPKSVVNKIIEQVFKPIKEKICSTADWILNHVPEPAKIPVNKS